MATTESVAERHGCLLRLDAFEVSGALMREALQQIFEALRTRELGGLLDAIRKLVPDYEPQAGLLARAERALKELA